MILFQKHVEYALYCKKDKDSYFEAKTWLTGYLKSSADVNNVKKILGDSAGGDIDIITYLPVNTKIVWFWQKEFTKVKK